MTDNAWICDRCGRMERDDAPGFAEWEAAEGGQTMICPDCLTPDEIQAIDDQDNEDEVLWRLDPDSEHEFRN